MPEGPPRHPVRKWFVVAGILLGLVAGLIANSYFTGRESRAALGGTTKVAVAAMPLAYGNDITADKVRFVDYPNSAIPPGSFTNAAQLMGKKRVALMPIGVNEPILASKISGAGQGASAAAAASRSQRSPRRCST